MCQKELTAVDIQENFLLYFENNILNILLKDRSSGQNIIWATDDYSVRGAGYAATDEISIEAITEENGDVICPRALKSKETQGSRTRNMAEVFTPLWICNKQNNLADAAWFEREDVFNTESGREWTPRAEKIAFSEEKEKSWRAYLASKRLEITCGEAPYLVSRYDTLTGAVIPLEQRIGLLDRKLRVINERTRNFKDREKAKKRWLELARLAVQSIYGYEWAGDNVLLARENVLYTVVDFYAEKFAEPLDGEALEQFAEIISWNIWQMDGLKAVVPLSCHDYKKERQAVSPNLFLARDFSARTLKRSISFCDVDEHELQKCQGCLKDNLDLHNGVYCKIKNWSTGKVVLFKELLEEEGSEEKMAKDFKFDVVIGNPPYQQNSKGDNESDTPLYHYFYKSAFAIADKVELITPARFLFNAGYTPKSWNEEMLNDTHLKVMYYEPKSNLIFANTDIKGGVVITYRDRKKEFGAIGIFTVYPELNSIRIKVERKKEASLTDIITNRGIYRYSEIAYTECPVSMSKTADARVAPSAFERMPELFSTVKPKDEYDYIQIYGNIKSERLYKWIRKCYIKDNDNLNKYKVIVPKANGNGRFGEVLSNPIICNPMVGFTETYIAIGATKNIFEAENILKYIKSKFARTMLSILKVTQNNAKPAWKFVPLQDFTPSSDIDWSKSIHEIDLQLYKKYNLSSEEIDFIEKNVKEME